MHLHSLVHGGAESLASMAAKPLPHYWTQLEMRDVVCAPAHIAMMAHHMVVILNEIRLPVALRASPPLVETRPATSQRPSIHCHEPPSGGTGDVQHIDRLLSDDERNLALILQKFNDIPSISVTQAGQACRRLKGNQPAIARVFALAEQLGLGRIEGAPAPAREASERRGGLTRMRCVSFGMTSPCLRNCERHSTSQQEAPPALVRSQPWS